MHRDAEDILNNRGRGAGCHGTYNVAWYKCSSAAPLYDDARDIFRAVFAENRYCSPSIAALAPNLLRRIYPLQVLGSAPL
jgi:hypothetical protein